MPVNKLLSRIRASIQDLTPALESFRDENIQPGVEDCTRLQQHANELLELIGAYKYTKQDNELSPSYKLHAHISETVENMQQDVIPQPEPAPPSPPAPEASKAEVKEKAAEPAQPKSGNGNGRTATKALFIGINDKFRFINELFAHNDAEYNIAIEQLSNLKAWPETELYLASLKNLYEWKENHDAVKYFYNIVKRRFQ
jgi:hypothetical protein